MNSSPNSTATISVTKFQKLLIRIIVVLLVFTVGFIAGKSYSIDYAKGSVMITRDLPANHESVDFSLFWEVWDTLQAKYYQSDSINQESLVYGAIQGMVGSVGDPYTVFLKPDQNKVVREDLSGSFQGVGIQIGYRDNLLAVIAPLSDSPAEVAGVKAGDIIVGISDKKADIDVSTADITLHEAVEYIRGEAGSTVTLTLARDGVDKPFDIDIKRESIDVPTVELSFVGKDRNVALIKLTRFGGETTQEWETVVQEILKNRDTDNVILDVRNNPGGYLQAANDLASEFLEIGETVVIEEDSKGERIEYTVDRIGRLKKYGVVVLMNEGSASASEILAGALRDNKKTKLIGESSFGKGTIQEPQQLENNVGLHITIARWLTPNGTWVNEKGLEPDTTIEDNPDTETDEQLVEALHELGVE